MKPLIDNFNGLKMLSMVEHWKPLEKNIIPPPIANSLDLSSTSACPNRCYFCDVRWSMNDQPTNMTDETFTHVLKVYQNMGIRSACIAGGGESLVNPRCEDYFQEIINIGTQIGIITNGRIYRHIPSECRFVNV